jgi:hypothetical protein
MWKNLFENKTLGRPALWCGSIKKGIREWGVKTGNGDSWIRTVSMLGFGLASVEYLGSSFLSP